ncbi:hypothetical protein Voja6_00094 [Pseudomonas phage vB_PpuM-Voja-6]
MNDTQDPNVDSEPGTSTEVTIFMVTLSGSVDVDTESGSKQSTIRSVSRLAVHTDASFFDVEAVARQIFYVDPAEAIQEFINRLKECEGVTIVNVSSE